IKLRDTYPNEAHFHAHLGRFYSNKLHRYRDASECMEAAIALSDHDPVLHHMRGMILRQQVYELIDQEGELQKIIELVKEASDSFVRARELNPDNEHGYISEVQMLAKVVDYAGRKNGGVLVYLHSSDVDPVLRDFFERAEDLLEQVRRNREG